MIIFQLLGLWTLEEYSKSRFFHNQFNLACFDIKFFTNTEALNSNLKINPLHNTLVNLSVYFAGQFYYENAAGKITSHNSVTRIGYLHPLIENNRLFQIIYMDICPSVCETGLNIYRPNCLNGTNITECKYKNIMT